VNDADRNGIVTERLYLRPLGVDDFDAVALLGADERVMRTLGGVSKPDKARAWLETELVHWREHGFGRYVVRCGEEFVGVVGLSRSGFDAGLLPGVEIAWRLRFERWDRGYATEAARAVLRHGFERLGLGEIIAVTTPGNARSLRVMERLGMVHSPGDGFDHPRVPHDDPLRHHVVHRLPRTLWQSLRG
jgi:RimJ/RimL family protein N-acetyltransferase